MKKKQKKQQALLEQEFEELEEIEYREHENRLKEMGISPDQQPPAQGDTGSQKKSTLQDGDSMVEDHTVSATEAESTARILPTGKLT